MKKIVLFILVFIITHTSFAVELSVPSVFADHMVLQQGQEVPVWGISEPGAIVEVVFAGQKKTVKVDNDGKWRINLDALKVSSESRVLVILSKLNGEISEIKISDVLVGEVWFCSGQSNMYRPFRMLMGEAVDFKYEPIANYLRNEAATANDPLFRQYKVGRDQSVFKKKTEGRGNWSKAIPKEVNEFSGTAYFFGRELRRNLNIPVAIISCNLGGTKIEPWMPINAFKSNETFKKYYDKEISEYNRRLKTWNDVKETEAYNQLLKAWKDKVKQAELQGEKPPGKPKKTEHPSRDKQVPATLFNAMVHPIISYAVKGVLWYQGESNSKRLPEQYGARLKAMVKAWRAAWEQDTVYFYACQLANYRKPNELPVADDDGWALVSYGQSQILDLENTGLAVLNDIGEARDIHPKNKIDAGKRLSLWALKQAYNQNIVCSGPVYKSSEIKDDTIIIQFSHVGSGLMVGKKHLMEPTIEVNEPLKRFQIRGKDGLWKWAKAKIIDKDKVKVWHNNIAHPVEVRYAWSSNPEGANLYNKEGLPASLFKTLN